MSWILFLVGVLEYLFNEETDRKVIAIAFVLTGIAMHVWGH